MILQEQDLSASGAVDPDETVRIGKLVGSAALIFGNVGRRDYSRKNCHENKTCGEKNRPYPCTEHVVTGTWTEQVHFKVVDTTTGKVIAMKNVERSRHQRVSAIDATPAATWDVESVSADLDREVVRGFRMAIGQFRAACGKADADPGIKPQLRARARYDLGVALGYSGSYDEGIRELEKAVQIQAEEIFVREIRKIKLFRSDAERLRQQGMDTAP